MKKIRKKNKKGISVIVGYVLLIALGIVMSVIVYSYLRTSIAIRDFICNNNSYSLNLTLRNNGNFNVNGFFIYGTTTPTQELAVQDLSVFTNNNSNVSETGRYGNSVRFSNIKNSFAPGEERTANFTLDYPVYSIEIMPARFQGESNKEKLVSCTNAKIKQKLSCW
jgi:hypothetical protein